MFTAAKLLAILLRVGLKGKNATALATYADSTEILHQEHESRAGM